MELADRKKYFNHKNGTYNRLLTFKTMRLRVSICVTSVENVATRPSISLPFRFHFASATHGPQQWTGGDREAAARDMMLKTAFLGLVVFGQHPANR